MWKGRDVAELECVWNCVHSEGYNYNWSAEE